MLVLAFLMRLPWLILAIVTFLLVAKYTDYLLLVFFVILTLHSFSSGLTTPVWFDLVSKLIPAKRRGTFFGVRSFLGSLLGIVAAFSANLILRQFVFPTNFSLLFALAFVGAMLSFVCLVFVKEPIYPITYKKTSYREYFSKLPKIITSKSNFVYFLISIIFIQFFAMANGLFAVAGFDKLSLSTSAANEAAGTFTMILILSQTLTTLIWGRISDRYCHKLVILLAAMFNILGVLAALFANSLQLFYVVFFLIGIASGGNAVSFMTIVPEFCSEKDRPTYIAITNTVSGLISFIASLLGGFLVDVSGYTFVFLLTLTLMLLGTLILSKKVEEPRLQN